MCVRPDVLCCVLAIRADRQILVFPTRERRHVGVSLAVHLACQQHLPRCLFWVHLGCLWIQKFFQLLLHVCRASILIAQAGFIQDVVDGADRGELALWII